MTATIETAEPAAANGPSVLFISRAYPPIRGGMEQFSYDLTTSIASRVRAHIIANRGGKATLPLFLPIALARGFVRAPQYDVIHAGDPVLAGVAWALTRLRNRPTAMTIHGLDIVYPSRLYQAYLRRFLPIIDLCICISRYVERVLTERFKGTRTLVIPPGIRDTFYQPNTPRESLARLVGEEVATRPVLLSVGRLVPRKGVAWFVTHVLPRLPRETLYVVAGTGPERSTIASAAAAGGLQDRVKLLGSVSDDDLRVLYNTVDLFVMPNILVDDDIEGFGLVALEAASCGLPVVASAVQGIVDAVYDGRNGVLVAAGDADDFATRIASLLFDREALRRSGVVARAFTLTHFSWNMIAQRYITAFSHLRRL